MCHRSNYLPSAGHRAPNEKELREGYENKEQGDSGSESEWGPSPLLMPNLHLPEAQNPSPSVPPVPKTQKSASNAKAEEEISPVAPEGPTRLLNSTNESSEYSHQGNGEEEPAVELQNYMCTHDAEDGNWECEKEKYVCILMGALQEGFGAEDGGVRTDSTGERKREFCDEGEGVRGYGRGKKRIMGDERYLTGRRAG